MTSPTATPEQAETTETSINPLAAAAGKMREFFERLGTADHPSPFSRLVQGFDLSTFEADILALAAAVELDQEVGELCAAMQGDARFRYPTFALAMASLDNAHWSAIQPRGALRRWLLLEVGAADTLTSAPLRIDEAVLHFLMGSGTIDERLDSLLETVDPPAALPSSYRAHAEGLLALWREGGTPPLAVLQGNAVRDKRRIAAAASASVGLRLRLLVAARIPKLASERTTLIRLLSRDAVLNRCALMIDCDNCEPTDQEGVRFVAERFPGVVIVAGEARLQASSRGAVSFAIDRPAPIEQSALWRYALGEKAERLNGDLDRLSAQFSLEAESILDMGRRVARTSCETPQDIQSEIWKACRDESRPVLEGLAQRVVTNARWDDLVLSENNLEALRAMVAQARNQNKVLQDWGFAAQTPRGLGASALFCGHSGTGKTLAAEVLANELGLDLVRIDLSQVVSKYIGETEKNLRSIFDAAENTGAVLLFDEADALFGKRSEVHDSHDRYANIEVSYLLQRMEAYRGLALLTTNLRTALDPSFLRRIRFVLQFPFPDLSQRREIWQRMFPPALPTDGIDFDKLAKLNLPGGNIRNIALSGAYLAAESNEPLRMKHLLIAARRECAKLERPLSDKEVGGWA
jgi:ATP-dependent 26S proteasome regulatory subunit